MREPLRRIQAYWDAYADRIDAAASTRPSREFFAEVKAQHDKVYNYANHILDLHSLKGRSLLEVGCGIGLDTVEFARHGAQVTAVDLSPRCLALAKRLLGYHNVNATLAVGNAEELPLPARSFDIVVARGVLMYAVNDLRIVDEIFRVLKPWGEANILLHNQFSWYTFLARISRANLYDEVSDPPINRLYSIWKAREICKKAHSFQIFLDRFPTTTKVHRGSLAWLYNQVIVPCSDMLPRRFLRPFGFYIILQATK